MRKIAFLFFTSTFLWSAPVGNPVSPDLIEKGVFTPCDSSFNFRLGYEGDFVSDGRMKQNSGERVDFFEQYTNSAIATLNLLDRVDLYGVLGSSVIRSNWRFELFSDETIHRIKIKTDADFLWAVGGRAILYQWWNTFLGFGGRYSFCNYHNRELSSDGEQYPVESTHLIWKQWQLNLDLSYKIHLFTPYIGVKYSQQEAKIGDFSVPISSNGLGSNQLVNRDPVGFYLGCGLCSGKYLMINLEGRLIDEEAISLTADLRF